MKIRFLKAKDKVVLLEDGSIAKTVEAIVKYVDTVKHEPRKHWGLSNIDSKLLDENITFLPKGTELIVSKVYIRNKGWDEDSINFILPEEYRVHWEHFGDHVTDKLIRIFLEDIENWEIDRIREESK